MPFLGGEASRSQLDDEVEEEEVRVRLRLFERTLMVLVGEGGVLGILMSSSVIEISPKRDLKAASFCSATARQATAC